MTIDYQKLRLDGVYKQNDQGQLMLRAKIPAGVLSSEQAFKLAKIAEMFAGARVHLTSRGSIEFHDLDYNDLPEVTRCLAAVGLTSRGACGGAVRGISCSSALGENFGACQALARKLHRHFAGNPYFEGLPKKFKIGVDGDYRRARHLIQDVGLVCIGATEVGNLYDIWIAGGLGREPQAGFRLAEQVAEAELIPLIESIVRAYKKNAEKGKRLKHLLNQVGEKQLRRLIDDEADDFPEATDESGLGATLSPRSVHADIQAVVVPVFAGELASRDLQTLAELASRFTNGSFALTADQDIAFFPPEKGAAAQLRLELAANGLLNDAPEQQVTFRICPGSHECRMGLSPTRDIARQIIDILDDRQKSASWAISGCPNSCSQPQLADYGVITSKLVKDGDDRRVPLFDLVRRKGDGLGEIVAAGLDFNALKAHLKTSDNAN